MPATKKSGPRASAGKHRASRNAFKHGLAINSQIIFAAEIDSLATEIAGEGAAPKRVESARKVAQALIDLERVSQVKLALFDRMAQYGTLKRPALVPTAVEEVVFSVREIKQIFNAFECGEMPMLRRDTSKPLPENEQDAAAEVLLRILPTLVQLDRYEASAAARLRRGFRALRALN